MAMKLKELLPNAKIISVDDHEHVPYGNQAPKDIIELTKTAIAPLLKDSCDVIIIACNTATTVAISALRKAYPAVNFIGIEPMIKPAAETTKSGIIGVLATPRTLQSNRYKQLKQTWTKGIKILEPDCKNWAKLIESGESNKIDVESVIQALVKQNADVIVLGCTHYHMIKQRIQDVAGQAVTVFEPTDAIASRIKSLLG